MDWVFRVHNVTVPDTSLVPSWVDSQHCLNYPQMCQYQELSGQSCLPNHKFPEIYHNIYAWLIEQKSLQELTGKARSHTEIEKKSFWSNSDCLLSALKNRFASFCWLIPPLRPKSTKPCSSTYLSYKDSFIISTTSCMTHSLNQMPRNFITKLLVGFILINLCCQLLILLLKKIALSNHNIYLNY